MSVFTILLTILDPERFYHKNTIRQLGTLIWTYWNLCNYSSQKNTLIYVIFFYFLNRDMGSLAKLFGNVNILSKWRFLFKGGSPLKFFTVDRFTGLVGAFWTFRWFILRVGSVSKIFANIPTSISQRVSVKIGKSKGKFHVFSCFFTFLFFSSIHTRIWLYRVIVNDTSLHNRNILVKKLVAL